MPRSSVRRHVQHVKPQAAGFFPLEPADLPFEHVFQTRPPLSMVTRVVTAYQPGLETHPPRCWWGAPE